MIGHNPLKAKLANKQTIYGILNSVPSPVICEMLAFAGYDFVIVDTEHVLISSDELAHCIRAAQCAGVPILVRVPDANPSIIGKILDAGASGIVVSRVSSAQMAKDIVQAAKYPPIGQRGITGGRNTGFGTLPLAQYIAKANQEVFIALMIECPQGLAAISDITSLDHIDMIIEGALDLSLSLGHGTDVNHHQVQAAIHTMAAICRASNMPFCAIPRTLESQHYWQQHGTQAYLVGEDRGMIFKHLKQQLDNYLTFSTQHSIPKDSQC